MYDKKLTAILPPLLCLALAICLFFNMIPSAGAQEKSQTSKPESPTASTTAAKSAANPTMPTSSEKSSGGREEGIQVHGHWTIVVKNADGTVASTNEFQNSLQITDGIDLLARILGRLYVPGPWTVSLGSVLSYSEFQGTLTTAVTGATFTLTGTKVAPTTGNITTVGSSNKYCSANTTPANCITGDGASLGFTSHPLATPIPVQSGQTVDVSISITFS